MNDLSQFPSMQLNYLSKLIKENEDRIRNVIFDSEHDQKLRPVASKYKEYLLKYISLLSDIDPFLAAKECEEDFYPIKECIIEV
jgi:hypothetical protein